MCLGHSHSFRVIRSNAKWLINAGKPRSSAKLMRWLRYSIEVVGNSPRLEACIIVPYTGVAVDLSISALENRPFHGRFFVMAGR